MKVLSTARGNVAQQRRHCTLERSRSVGPTKVCAGPHSSKTAAPPRRVLAVVALLATVAQANAGEPNGTSTAPALAGKGRYIAFQSTATNWVAGDTNGASDIFLNELSTGKVSRISVSSQGGQANGASASAAITPDGRYIAFESSASNLVGNDTNQKQDVFVHDRETGSVERISRASSDQESNGASSRPSISADGRYVAFESAATNLVASDSNGATDAFIYDRTEATTDRVGGSSELPTGADDPVISGNGRYVAFVTTSGIDPPAKEGDYVCGVHSDNLNDQDVYVYDRTNRSIAFRASARWQPDDWGVCGGGEWITGGDGPSKNPSISYGGRFVAYETTASNLASCDTNGASDVFRHDSTTGGNYWVSERMTPHGPGNGPSFEPSISSNGGYVLFETGRHKSLRLHGLRPNGARDVVAFERQVYDDGTDGHVVERISKDHETGAEPNGFSGLSSSGPYGDRVAFVSDASNLTGSGMPDTNGKRDVFVYRSDPAERVRRVDGQEVSGPVFPEYKEKYEKHVIGQQEPFPGDCTPSAEDYKKCAQKSSMGTTTTVVCGRGTRRRCIGRTIRTPIITFRNQAGLSSVRRGERSPPTFGR